MGVSSEVLLCDLQGHLITLKVMGRSRASDRVVRTTLGLSDAGQSFVPSLSILSHSVYETRKHTRGMERRKCILSNSRRNPPPSGQSVKGGLIRDAGKLWVVCGQGLNQDAGWVIGITIFPRIPARDSQLGEGQRPVVVGSQGHRLDR